MKLIMFISKENYFYRMYGKYSVFFYFILIEQSLHA